MKNPDEPLFDGHPAPDEPDPGPVHERVRALVERQPYAVLCVQGEGQPYGALVAFAFSGDLRHACFVTPMATRKYRLLTECDHVALVVPDEPATGALLISRRIQREEAATHRDAVDEHRRGRRALEDIDVPALTVCQALGERPGIARSARIRRGTALCAMTND